MKTDKPIPLVLENRKGQVLRSLSWDLPQLVLARRLSTGRLEILPEIHHEDEESYEVIREVDLDELQRKPLAVGDFAYLRRVEDGDRLRIVASEPILQEDDEEFKKSLKRSFLAHLALCALGLIVFLVQDFMKEEEAVVKIELPKEMKLPAPVPKQKAAPVKPSKKKIVAKNVAVRKAPRANRPVRKAVTRQAVARKNVTQMGALAALGGGTAGKKGGRGLRLDSALSGPGSGDSAGTRSLGDATVAFAGKGLTANSGGGGKTNLGQVGYGTKGRSGGQSGYGQMNIGGSGDGGGYEPAMLGGGSVEGGLEMSQIEAVIQQNIGQIYYCYEKGLQQAPQLQGRVVTDFVINGAGRVSVAQVGQSSLRSAQVEKCMLGKLKGWKFPKPVGNVDVQVSYPFNLKRAR